MNYKTNRTKQTTNMRHKLKLSVREQEFSVKYLKQKKNTYFIWL